MRNHTSNHCLFVNYTDTVQGFDSSATLLCTSILEIAGLKFLLHIPKSLAEQYERLRERMVGAEKGNDHGTGMSEDTERMEETERSDRESEEEKDGSKES